MTLITINDKRFKENIVGKKAFNIHLLQKHGFPTLRGLVLKPPISDDEYLQAWDYFSPNPVLAVRSSMLNEDGSITSMAGKFETVLGVQTLDDFKRAVEKVVASADTPSEASVFIQPMCDSHISGVLFTRTSPNNNFAYIESTYGLGETIVGGKIAPDRFLINIKTNEIEKKISPLKFFGIFLEKTTLELGEILNYSFGTARKVSSMGKGRYFSSIPYQERKKASLTETQLQQLVKLATEIETSFGCPQDIEFAIENDSILILQTRPITSYLHLETLSMNVSNSNETRLSGMIASPGEVVGIVISDFEKEDEILEPFIYVGFETRPELLYHLDKVVGIVTESGGLLSHASIVSRELNIPCLVSVTGALSKLKQGEQIRLNATEGYIERGGIHQSKN